MAEWDPWTPPAPDDVSWWDTLTQKALSIESDGCTKVTQLYKPCCYLHDLLWREFCQDEKDYAAADLLFLRCMQAHSPRGRWGLLPYIRYAGVRTLGRWFFRPKKD